MNLTKFTSKGKFLMLALDHRGSFKKLMNPANPDSVSDEQVIQLKSEIIQALSAQFSGLLIDETWGLDACKEVCSIKPFLLPLEKTGYTPLRQGFAGRADEGGERVTELEYSVAQIKEMGASGAKLLLYFNPKAESAGKQIETSRKVMEDCKQNNFPFFLEIVTYKLPQVQIQFHPGGADSNLVKESVKMFLDNGIIPSVWKLEYPGSEEGCRQITELVGHTPWILLTGGQSFEEFRPELEIAIKGGAKGFLAGRALWQEVCTMDGEEKEKFLSETLPARFKDISVLASSSGQKAPFDQ